MMRVVFMGTGNFALPTLQKLILNKNFNIVAIYSKDPKIKGKKKHIPVIFQEANKHNIKIFTPKSLKNSKEQNEFIALNADIAIIVSYGLLLPSEILKGTKFGCINLHPSLLPRWRGAAPIERSIENGDKYTGISIILMNEELDSGDIIFQNKFTIGNYDGQTLSEIMAQEGAGIICDILSKFPKNEIIKTVQDENKATYAKKVLKSELEINWNDAADNIIKKIKAFSGKGGCYFILNNKRIKIFSAKLVKDSTNYSDSKIGEPIGDNFIIKCKKDAIKPIMLQQEGKRTMELKDFLLGFGGSLRKNMITYANSQNK